VPNQNLAIFAEPPPLKLDPNTIFYGQIWGAPYTKTRAKFLSMHAYYVSCADRLGVPYSAFPKVDYHGAPIHERRWMLCAMTNIAITYDTRELHGPTLATSTTYQPTQIYAVFNCTDELAQLNLHRVGNQTSRGIACRSRANAALNDQSTNPVPLAQPIKID
jgi:hypothetical protein